MEHLLDNPVWASLGSGNIDLALGNEDVKYFPDEVSPFAGMRQTNKNSLRVLYEITPGPDGVYAVQTSSEMVFDKPWTVVLHIPVYQMIFDGPTPRPPSELAIVDLSDEEIPQMMELTKLTNPGPFRVGTIKLGHYQGIFSGSKLVAMAGQRMHPTPYAEISAVCTHPDYVGKGYGSALLKGQIIRIRNSEEVPFLHVATANSKAIKLYQSLGFAIRKSMNVYIIKK